jgi:hypothetical protein
MRGRACGGLRKSVFCVPRGRCVSRCYLGPPKWFGLGAGPWQDLARAHNTRQAEPFHCCQQSSCAHALGRQTYIAVVAKEWQGRTANGFCVLRFAELQCVHQVLSSGRSGPRPGSRGPRLTPWDHDYTGARRCRDGLGSGPVPGLPVPRVVLWVAVLQVVSIAANGTCTAASVLALESRCEQLHKARLSAPFPCHTPHGLHAESLSAGLHRTMSPSLVISLPGGNLNFALLGMAVGSCPGPTLVNASDVSSVTVMRSNVKYRISMDWSVRGPNLKCEYQRW